MQNPNHIFVDTNVLIGTYCDNEHDKRCLQYLFSLRGKRLYTSSLSIAQLISVFQKTKTNGEIKTIVRDLLSKFTIIGFVTSDIEKSLLLEYSDMEDSIQYVICRKFHCLYFITNNVRDYRKFININILKPAQIRLIRQ